MKRRWLPWVLGLLALVLVAAGVLRAVQTRRAHQAAAHAAQPAAETIVTLAPTDVLRATRRTLIQELPVSGTLRAVDSAMVKARVPGELRDLRVREGDSVRAGQVIARIEPVEYESRVRQAQEQAGAARAQVEVAQRAFENNKALVAQGFISPTALEASQSNLNAVRATYQAALAGVDVANKAMADTVLRSPIDGQVSQRLAQPGERVGVEARVVEVVNLGRIELEATVAAADSVAVRVGQRAVLQIEGSRGANSIVAHVARINPSAQPGSRNVLVYLRLDSPEGMRQGLFAQGSVEVGRTEALALARTAVRVDKPAPYVQAVANGRIVHLPVHAGLAGREQGQEFVAIDGIAEGTLVVAGSVGPMREGTAVRLTPVSAPAP